MANWYTQLNIDREQLNEKIKGILLSHKLCKGLLEYYKIPEADVKNSLQFEIKELEGKFAEGNGKVIFLDPKLFKDDFFDNNFHFVIHEFHHWLKRRSESKWYFNDPEEVQSFILAMAWELLEGKTPEQVTQTFYPIIEGHFEEEQNAKSVIYRMIDRAKQIAGKVLQSE